MDILYLLVPVSVVLVFVIGIVFWWSIRHGQFEDLDGPAYRVVMDDDLPPQPPSCSDSGPVGTKASRGDERGNVHDV
jgi:cbb3-type cytochrome oxidase maturation protein